jgi:hypothetical protein
MKVLLISTTTRGVLATAVCISTTLFTTHVKSAEPCPQIVESRAGSVFNMSAFIKDHGSPEAALDTARAAVSKVNQGGGCSIFNNAAACEETLALAGVAIAALQTCIASPGYKSSQKNGGQRTSKDVAND